MKGTRKRERKVFLAILLVSAVLFAGTGLFTKNVRAETEAKADETGTDDSEMTVNVPETDGKEDGSGYKVIYDTVFFGEYPQSEVLTNEMIGKEPQAEDGSMYGASEVVVDDELYSKLSAAGYDGAGDTVLEGARYRRVASASDSSEVAWRYFRYDPIRWRVLGVHSIEYTDRIAECALLLSDQALDVLPFDEDGAGIWEDSSLRKWLNGSFINMAFTEDEYWNDIAVVEEEASDGSFETYDSDTDITDDVFLLSGSDLFGESAQEYGFIQSKDNTFLGAGEDIARYARATRYALATELNDRGSEQDDKDSALVSWWSRSSVSDTEAGIVDYIGEGGYAAKDMTGIGIRPTLWLDLENASEDYVYAGMLVITPERCEIVDPEDESGEEDIKEKEEQEKKEEPEKKEETEKPEEPEKQEQTEKQEEPKEPEKQEPDKENVGIEKTGKYSDGMLYMSAEWFINRLDVEDFDDRVTERIEVVDMEENLPGKWLVFGQTDYDNPANESYDPETQESYYPLFAQHMKADVTAIGSGYSMTVDSYEMLDCDTGEISVDGVIETLTAGAIEKSTDETEEKIEFEGSANIEISRIFKLDDRLYAAGRITYTSGESVLICMVRETGSNVAADTDRKE